MLAEIFAAGVSDNELFGISKQFALNNVITSILLIVRYF